MLWTHEAQPSGMSPQQILTTVMTRIVVDKSTDNARPLPICFLPQYQRQRNYFYSEREVERELKIALGDTWTCAALSVLLLTTAN